MRNLQKGRGKARGRRRHPEPQEGPVPTPVDDVASAFVKTVAVDGVASSASEKQGENLTPEERGEQILDNLTNLHRMDPLEARRRLEEIVVNNRRATIFTVHDPNSVHFFTVETLPDLVQVVLNEAHPAYGTISAALDDAPEDASVEDLQVRLYEASDAVKLLLFAWAFMEDRKALHSPRDPLVDLRIDWGKAARDLFNLYRGNES